MASRSNTSRRGHRPAAVALALLVPWVAGCSDNSSKESGTTSSSRPATSSPATTDGTDAKTVAITAYFRDDKHYETGVEPMVRAVPRTAIAPDLAAGALDALFAGPTPEEKAQGLSFVASEATGYTDLRIKNGVASVRLTGGCNSRGSTFTIGSLIEPTLRQFPTVEHVKILDPDGNTEEPSGTRDSIPLCLEP